MQGIRQKANILSARTSHYKQDLSQWKASINLAPWRVHLLPLFTKLNGAYFVARH
jgi:hypothetical protein